MAAGEECSVCAAVAGRADAGGAATGLAFASPGGSSGVAGWAVARLEEAGSLVKDAEVAIFTGAWFAAWLGGLERAGLEGATLELLLAAPGAAEAGERMSLPDEALEEPVGSDAAWRAWLGLDTLSSTDSLPEVAVVVTVPLLLSAGE